MRDEIRRTISKLNNRPKKPNLNSPDLAGLFTAHTDEKYTSPESWILTGRFMRLLADQTLIDSASNNPIDDLFSKVRPSYEEVIARPGISEIINEADVLISKSVKFSIRIMWLIAAFGTNCAEYRFSRAVDNWLNHWGLKSSRYRLFAEMVLISAVYYYDSKANFRYAKDAWESAVFELQSLGEFLNFPSVQFKPPTPLDRYAGIGRDEYIKQYVDEAELLLNSGVLKLLGASEKEEITKSIKRRVCAYCDRVEKALLTTPHKRKRKRADSSLERNLRLAVARIIHRKSWDELAGQEAERTKSQYLQFTPASRKRSALLRVYKGVRELLLDLGLPRHVAFDDPNCLPEPWDFLKNNHDTVNKFRHLITKLILDQLGLGAFSDAEEAAIKKAMEANTKNGVK